MEEYRNIILYLNTLKKEIEKGKDKKDLFFTIEMIEENIKNNLEKKKSDLKYMIENNTKDLELLNYFENVRKCSDCKKELKKGYCINDGQEYYCSDKCLYNHYTKDEYNNLYNNNCAYYTEWEQ